MSNHEHGPELPLENAVILGERAKQKPQQIKPYDNRDDRIEIANLLKHLPPQRRLRYFVWAVSQAVFPGTLQNRNLRIAPSTFKLAKEARHCDRANEALTIDILQSMAYLWTNHSINAKACLEELIRRVRGKS